VRVRWTGRDASRPRAEAFRRASRCWCARERRGEDGEAVARRLTRPVQVVVPPHPLIQHWLAIARNEFTPSPAFRTAVAEIGKHLVYEACREWLPTVEMECKTPMGMADVQVVDQEQPVLVVPILRAGLVLLESARDVLPASKTYHVGYVRDETTLLPTMYLNKLPDEIDPQARVLVSDPMLATGGTMVACLDELITRGADPSLVRIVSVVAAPPALKKISEKYQGVRVYAAMIDPELSEQGYIVPGLGDAGDRAFGTE